MPDFLERRLENEARAKHLTGKKAAGYVYGTMNNLGAMHGNNITAKGREMEKKHEEDTMSKHEPMREMRIQFHRQGGKLSGMTVHHEMMPKQSKSPAFYEDRSEQVPFGADGMSTTHGHINDHVAKHVKGQISGAGASKGDNEAMNDAEEEEEEAVEPGE